MLRLFVNRFTVFEKKSVLNREYLTHPVHMQLCQKQKQKTFYQFLSSSFKSILNFEHIQKTT